VKLKTSPVIMQTVTEHGAPPLGRKRVSIALAKCHEQRSPRFLIVGQFPPIFVLPIERTVGHRITRVGRTLLSVAFDSVFPKLDSRNIKGGGQECPPYTWHCTVNFASLSVTNEQFEMTCHGDSHFGKFLVNMAKLHDRA
jgi:hypothetical protein